MQHDWPGNVRELQQVMERSLILCESAPTIAADHIAFANFRRGLNTLSQTNSSGLDESQNFTEF
jgi:transcriptional regulator with PAS, ATPase and Fis domain